MPSPSLGITVVAIPLNVKLHSQGGKNLIKVYLFAKKYLARRELATYSIILGFVAQI